MKKLGHPLGIRQSKSIKRGASKHQQDKMQYATCAAQLQPLSNVQPVQTKFSACLVTTCITGTQKEPLMPEKHWPKIPGTVPKMGILLKTGQIMAKIMGLSIKMGQIWHLHCLLKEWMLWPPQWRHLGRIYARAQPQTAQS